MGSRDWVEIQGRLFLVVAFGEFLLNPPHFPLMFVAAVPLRLLLASWLLLLALSRQLRLLSTGCLLWIFVLLLQLLASAIP